jgi:hypothetical protein
MILGFFVQEFTFMTTVIAERRRSNRLTLTIPLRVEVRDASGQTLECAGRATTLNRHGARIQLAQPLDCGQVVRVRSPIGHYEADFRVVEHIGSPGEQNGEYGVECLSHVENFWGIEFPDSNNNEPADAKVLLECRMCHTIALQPLRLTEVEALWTMGIVGKPCHNCATDTPWRYADVRVPPNQMAELARSSIKARANRITPRMETSERDHRRVLMQVRLGVRDAQGNLEVTNTDNTSQSGFCFTSEKTYVPGESVMVGFPYDPTTEKTELRARIVREQIVKGAVRKIYGAMFQSANCTRPAAA